MNLILIDLHCDATMPSGALEFGGGNTYSRGLLQNIINNPEITCYYVTRKKFPFLCDSEKWSNNCFMERITLGGFEVNDKDSLQNFIDIAIQYVETIIKKYGITNFMVHSSYWQSGLVAIEICKKYNTFFVHTIQSNGKKKKMVESKQENLDFRIKSEQQIFEQARYLICSCTAEQDEINRLYKIDKSKLIVTGLPISKEFYLPTKDKKENLLTYKIGNSTQYYLPTSNENSHKEQWCVEGSYVYFGRLHLDKGIKEIIHAWNNLNKLHNNVPPLWIVGGTSQQINDIRAILIEENIDLKKYEQNHKLLWWGTLSPADLSCILQKTLVVVTHSKYESGGLMVIEALASGTPVIATPYGYAQKYIINWYNGFLVDFGDINGLQLCMHYFANQPYLSEYLHEGVTQTYKRISNEFDFAQTHFSLYKQEIKQDNHKDFYSYGGSTGGSTALFETLISPNKLKEMVKQLLPLNNPIVTECGVGTDSSFVVFRSGADVYQVNAWFTTLNFQRIFDVSEKCLFTAKKKYNNITEYQHWEYCMDLFFYDAEHSITIIKYSSNVSPIDPISVVTLLQNISETISIKNPAKKHKSLSEEITNLNIYMNTYHKIYSKFNVQLIKKIISKLLDKNQHRQELRYVISPQIDSCLNIVENKLYGPINWWLAEDGYAVAVFLSNCNYSISDIENALINESDLYVNSIKLWYVLICLKKLLQDFIYNKTDILNDQLELLLGYLE